MASNEPAKSSTHVADSIATTLEWLITAFILAFVFRAFVMEAFRIPTGSMADTLRGAHFSLRCTQCGYKYEYGFIPYYYRLPDEYVPAGDVPIRPQGPRCPSCGYVLGGDVKMPVANGDRILVLKTIYQFVEPDRWDVFVFKNPMSPRVNYIKRLIGRPGETLEIIDGDIYINGTICRKPPRVQNELWKPVYDNDYRPVEPTEPHFNGHVWRQPFKNINDSKWQLTQTNNPTVFALDSEPNKINTVTYDTSVGNDFKATYAYDDTGPYEFLPIASDLKVRFYADSERSSGVVGIALSKYETLYRAWVDLSGHMVIIKSKPGTEPNELARKRITPVVSAKNVLIEFATIDHQLIFRCGDETLTFDLGSDPNAAGPRRTDMQPQVSIFGSGTVTLSHVTLFRDIHYLGKDISGGMRSLRASEGNPIRLGKDDFFAMGDNSPSSSDSRFWPGTGIGNAGKSYREGIVPREYLVGKAMFVYWPSGFRLFGGDRFGLCPNVGEVRFIYGGNEAYSK
ncbi:MAG: signal peptidase I [Sedimentisphaerales bacterium]|nr:signal peptidase I [Sedimentisphaerales bacterium]